MTGTSLVTRFDLKTRAMTALTVLPHPIWQAAIALAAEYLSWRPNKWMRRWSHNASVATGRTPTRREVAAAYRSWGRNLFESIQMGRMSQDAIRARVLVSDEDRRRLSEAIAAGGAVVALPHMGSWDLAGAWACVNGMPISTVAEQLDSKEFKLFLDVRERLGFTVYSHTDHRSVVKLIHDLREGAVVCLVADRDMSRSGVPVQWPTPTGPVTVTLPPGPALIAQRTGATLFPVACHYLGRGRMRAVIGPAVQHAPGRDGVAAMTQQVADFFAAQVASNVVDWHMLQRFFPNPADPPRAVGGR